LILSIEKALAIYLFRCFYIILKTSQNLEFLRVSLTLKRFSFVFEFENWAGGKIFTYTLNIDAGIWIQVTYIFK